MDFAVLYCVFLYKNALLALVMSDRSTDDSLEPEKYPAYSAKDLNVRPFGFLSITVHVHCSQCTVPKD